MVERNPCLMNESETFTTVESIFDMNGPRIATAMIFQAPGSSLSEWVRLMMRCLSF
jgi:hypothetical protein